MKRNWIALAAAMLMLLVVGCALAEEEPHIYQVGDTLPDFSFTTYDGTEYTLSEVLKEKDMVLINIWATWCGPCRQEFPIMEEAYEEYKDRIEIFALSCEEEDTDEVIADFVAEYGMTFPTGRDTPNLDDAFGVTGIPTSIFIDRFGTVCLIEVGSQTNVDNFRRAFDVFVGDDYTESQLLDMIPRVVPTVEPTDPAELAQALNTGDNEITFANPEDEYNWPVILVEKDGRTAAETTCQIQNNGISGIDLTINAQEGDVLSFDYKTSTEPGYDYVYYAVNGKETLIGSGEIDWTTIYIPLKTAGETQISLFYRKDGATDDLEDKAWFANIKLYTGDEAAALRATLPDYPVDDTVSLTLVTEGSKEILLTDNETGEDIMGVPSFIVPADQAEFVATLTEEYNPAFAHFMFSSGEVIALSDALVDGAYTASCGYREGGFNYARLAPDPNGATETIAIFASEEAVDDYLATYFSDEDGTPTASWAYVEP